MRSKNAPEVWHASCLRDEIEQLTVAVRMLEFQDGYREGVAEARVAA